MPKAVLLLSGGLDSTTMLALATSKGYDVYAMTFRYGQRHASEIEAARRVAAHYDVKDHVVVDIDLRTFGGSAAMPFKPPIRSSASDPTFAESAGDDAATA